MDKFEKEKIMNCKQAIKDRDFSVAREICSCLLSYNDHSAEIYNLIGALDEITGNMDLALTHYRIAATVDPSHEKANKNLERITSINYKKTEKEILY